MKNLQKLVTGYKTFLEQNYTQEKDQARFRDLADHGQSPKIMVIGCCDSRVNPDLIFNTKPGDLFVVRNVANLVPPYEPDDNHHSTSAALEFAVTALKVQHIVILGHSLCGGIKACCDQVHGHGVPGEFIPQWTSIVSECAQKVRDENPNISEDELPTLVEQAAISASIKNLKKFPFVKKAFDAGDLQLHGAYFDIKQAQLFALDRETQTFLAME